MKIEQIYTGCLAQGAYYIQSGNEAVVIDPLRETAPYLQKARDNGATIKYIFETHFHADFVSGHVDLAKATGAEIVYGPTSMQTGFDAHIASDGEEFQVGNIRFRLIHTPGHTLESSCYLLLDEEGKETALFTGDTLFIGDVGRPDLAQKVIADLTPEKLGSMLYDSLRDKILPLPDDVVIYPAHGAGSACGKNMSKETSDLLGNQKKTNYALRDMSREQFLKELLDGLTPPPGYFPANVLMNIQGYPRFEEVLDQGTRALSPQDFELAANSGDVLVLDTREARIFARGFIPNSINIGIDGNFAPWAGTLIPDVNQKILLVTEPGRESEVVTRLSRVGYDHAIGYLEGGFAAWEAAGNETDTIRSIEVSEMQQWLDKASILDIRRKSEFDSEHVVGAQNLPLDYFNRYLGEIDPDKTYLVHCAGGYRSMIFVSVMKARGYDNLINVEGGFAAIRKAGILPVTEYVCPTTLL